MSNERIKGNFDYKKDKYIFRFTMNNINKFQIVLGGSLVKYQLVNVDSTVPCCYTFNETYYPEEGSTFIDTVIGDGTTKYNITIEVIAISTQPDPFISYFEITVIPFIYGDYPVYYIKNENTINCFTGKDNDNILILLKSI